VCVCVCVCMYIYMFIIIRSIKDTSSEIFRASPFSKARSSLLFLFLPLKGQETVPFYWTFYTVLRIITSLLRNQISIRYCCIRYCYFSKSDFSLFLRNGDGNRRITFCRSFTIYYFGAITFLLRQTC